jgi:hypothetical protein
VHLYAFEPVEAIFDVLRANVERCTAGDQLKIFDFGLSRTSGPVVFAYYPRAPVLSTAYPDEDADIEMAKEATLKNIMHFADAPLALRCLRWLPAGLRAPIVHYAIKRTLCSERVICQMQTLSRVVCDHGVERIDLLKIDADAFRLEAFPRCRSVRRAQSAKMISKQLSGRRCSRAPAAGLEAELPRPPSPGGAFGLGRHFQEPIWGIRVKEGPILPNLSCRTYSAAGGPKPRFGPPTFMGAILDIDQRTPVSGVEC